MPDMDTQREGLTLREAQREVDATIHALGGYWPPLANLARLFEECGELARAVNQAHGPKRVKPEETQAAAREELGDVLYVLLVLANSLDVDAEAALGEVLAKVRGRVDIPEPADPPREGARQNRHSRGNGLPPGVNAANKSVRALSTCCATFTRHGTP
jgi:NTP pyrophosphatase (non-canonical NTP hydrolase)